MADALAATGRPVVLSLCEWGRNRPWEWDKQVGSLWRTIGDIHECYDCKERWLIGWKLILDMQVGLERYSGPGRWNDPDMLFIGRPLMPYQENRAHFGLWCLLNAPLIAGNDVRNMPEKTRLILTNKDLIALNQDPLGKQGYRYMHEPEKREVWVKPLAGGDWGVIVFNTGKELIEKFSFDFADLKFLEGKTYTVRDLWAAEVGDTRKPWEGTLNWHDVACLRLSPA